MTTKQEKYLTEKYIRPMVKKMLKEEDMNLKMMGELSRLILKAVNNDEEKAQIIIDGVMKIFNKYK